MRRLSTIHRRKSPRAGGGQRTFATLPLLWSARGGVTKKLATPKKKAKAAARGAMRAIGKTATKFAAKGKISAACAQGIADTVQRLVDAIAAV